MIYFKIAFRNINKNKKQSLLFGISLFLICLFFLFGNALGNGSSTMMINRFRNFQSGDIAVTWKNIQDISVDDPGRMLFSEIDIETDTQNKEALTILQSFLENHQQDIEAVYTPVTSFGTLDTGEYASYASLYGLTKNELEHLFGTNIITLHEGASLFDYEYAAYISKEMAEQNNLDIGDWFLFDCPTVYGPVNSVQFQVAGIYRNGAPWDNVFVYTPVTYVREAMAIASPYISSARIYLNDSVKKEILAAELDSKLLEASDVLRAESSAKISGFWTTFADLQKSIYLFFSLFLLFVIGMGTRAGVRVTIYQRMADYGTFRAIGYSKQQNLLIIFFETTVLALISLATAAAVSTLLILFFGHVGFYVGNFGFEYITGSQFLFPEFNPVDLFMILVLLLIFSIVSPLKPALQLIRQKIPDLLSRNIKSGSLLKHFVFQQIHKIKQRSSIRQSAGSRTVKTGSFIDFR